LYQVITSYFKHSYRGIPIHYVIEDEPLGTGGAMRKAVKQVPDAGIVVTMNGDSLLLCDLAEMVHHLQDNVDLVMAVKYMPNTGRYGNVLLDDEKAAVDGFGEKRSDSDGYINGGI
jgi:D-glycero-alpha-D-manno-heptose 1-phosphate guanylyltransferase